MLRGIYTSAMGMQVQEMRQEAITNNLANVQTTGFKKSVMAFSADHWGWMGRTHEKYLQTPKGFKDARPAIGFMRGGSMVSTEVEDWEEGRLEETDNPLDIAIREPLLAQKNMAPGQNTAKSVHMFKVMDAKGNVFYTKNGAFTMDPEGWLVTRDGGYFVVVYNPATKIESPVKIMMNRPNDLTYVGESFRDTGGLDQRNLILDGMQNPYYNQPFVHRSGQINVNEQGYISIVDFSDKLGDNPQLQNRDIVGCLAIARVPVDGLVSRGRNVFSLTNDLLDPNDPNSRPRAQTVDLTACIPGQTPVVKSGVLERSNVSTVKEMVALLAANRMYEMNSRLVKAQDELLGRTVQDVGRSVR